MGKQKNVFWDFITNFYAAGQRINRIVGQMKNVRQYSTQSYVGNVKMIDFDRAVDKKEDGDEKAGENML